MQVTEEAARKMLKSMDFQLADKWNATKLGVKLNALDKLAEDAKVPEDEDDLRLFRRVTKALQDGEKIELEGGEEAPAPKKGKKKPAAGKGKKSGKAEGNGQEANGKPERGTSATGQLYLAWKKSKCKATPDSLHESVKDKLKLQSVKWYLAQWSKGNRLPAAAK